MTMIEKILARGAGRDRVEVGEFVVCEVDMTVLIDLQFASMWASPTRIADADRLAVVMDHAVPAPSVSDADAGVRARAFVKEHGIKRFLDVGPAEVYSIMCTGKTWFQVTPTIRYNLLGSRPDVISGKDIFLHIAGTYGEATNHNLEFGGPGLATVPMNDRRTIATQGAEVSADFTTFPADELCLAFLEGRAIRPYQPVDPDPDASYVAVREVDLSSLEPYV